MKVVVGLMTLAMAVGVANGKTGRWEATLVLGEALGMNESVVVRIGEEGGRMAVTGAAFPAVTVVATTHGWAIVKPGNFPTQEACVHAPPHALKLVFWGSERGAMHAEVMAPGGAWMKSPELGFSQEDGWHPPACPQEERWLGGLGELGQEAGRTLGFFEIKWVGTGSLFMVR